MTKEQDFVTLPGTVECTFSLVILPGHDRYWCVCAGEEGEGYWYAGVFECLLFLLLLDHLSLIKDFAEFALT